MSATLLEAESTSGVVRSRPGRWTRTAGIAVAVVVGVVVALFVFVFDVYTVEGGSMEPGLPNGSRIVVNRWGGADVDDLAVVRVDRFSDSMASVKRVVAVAGDEIAYDECVLFRNGEPVDEPYVADIERCGGSIEATVVPPGHLYVLGDNRAMSMDSRAFGPIPIDDVVGTVSWTP